MKLSNVNNPYVPGTPLYFAYNWFLLWQMPSRKNNKIWYERQMWLAIFREIEARSIIMEKRNETI